MPKYSVLIARQPFQRAEDPDVADWLVNTVVRMKQDKRISDVFLYRKDDTPAPMVRNDVVERLKQCGADYLLIIDNDMKADAYLPGQPSDYGALGSEPTAKPFWDSSFEFAINHDGPCIIGAPYCGPPPFECVYVFQWISNQTGHPNTDHGLQMFPREDAARRMGIEEVAALPTGLMLIDRRVFDILDPPYFKYEWRDKTESRKASTEDVYFTRDASLAGIKNYCNWDAWAGHWKRKCVGKPQLLTVDDVREQYRAALTRSPGSEKMLEIRPSKKGRKH